ncbi:patatin-like phospholipase family protein [Nocardioides cavernae]|uniref:Patatin-like phospholipase family protein n=1 Tax=Nocardioides cavernae TaxID=1921566 RepID=A0ABR8NH78_9ACTN|nr:patatin-like phospholipase family protein [Nocardioides cavernae]MBD3927461.1 patatin-like phospholipase family protein [Nocardioides cavernae]MBM7513218.1 patatin-like phospholipase/acyl hydrolase [Nocardioides cavernae]
MYRILSLDGGGVRGLVPGLILKGIEERARCRTADMFDLVAGTSTGAIVALGLLRPSMTGRPARTAQEVVDFYLAVSRTIFRRSWRHRIVSANGLLGPRYDAAALERSLEEEFGSAMLAEAVQEVLITSYDIKAREPRIFKSREMTIDGRQQVQLMKDVLRATAAAPTYFSPARLIEDGCDLHLVDGGTVANNPTLCAYAHAMDLVIRGVSDFAADEVVVLSIGTGAVGFDFATRSTLHGGALGWAKPLFDIVLDAQEDAVHYQMKRLLPEGERYFRLQPELPQAVDGRRTRVNEIDNAGAENLRHLRSSAMELLADTDTIDRIVDAFRPTAGSRQ